MTSNDLDARAINTIRALAMDLPEQARSGHQGTAMALAPLAHVLWTRIMDYDAEAPEWFDRDRFVLSAGHASMLQYALLHLAGFAVSLDDLKAFRQWGSNTPGHPEWHETPGVEAPHAEAPRVEGPRRDASRPATPRPGMPGPGSSGAATALNTDVIGAWALDHVEQAGKDAPELAKGRLVLDLKVDGTFAQTMDVATLEGTWVRSGSKLTLVTKSYDGQPLPPDSTVEETTDTLTVEGDVLVISDADVKFFLKRR